MNFLCDQCKQKYHVADEKIRGRAVTRFKCKKCEHVIELRMPEGESAPEGAGVTEGSTASLLPDKDLSGVTAAPMGVPPAPRTGMTGAHPAVKPAAPGAPTGALPTRQPTGTGLPVAPPRPAGSTTGALPTRQPTGTGLPVAAPRPAPTAGSAGGPLPTRQPTGTGLPVAAPRPASATASTGAGTTAARATATASAPVAAPAPRPAPATSPLRKNLAGTVEGPQKSSTAASALLNASETGWYAGVRDVPVGPLTRSELAAKIEAGDIHADTLVWREGLDDWRPLRAVQELSELVRNAAQKMSDGLLGTMGRPAPGAAAAPGGKVVPISQARVPGKPGGEVGGFGDGEDDSPTQMHSVSDLLTSKDPKNARAAARVAEALAPSPSPSAAAPAPEPRRPSIPPPAPEPRRPSIPPPARASVAPPPPAPPAASAALATSSSKPAEPGPDKSGWSWGAPGAEKPADPAAEKPAAPRPFATLNNAPVAKLPPAADPLAIPAAPSNPLGLPSLAAPTPPPSAAGAVAIGENTRVALGLPAPQKKSGVPVGVWILMAGFGAACLAVGLLLGNRQTVPTPAAPTTVTTPTTAAAAEAPTQRRVGTDIQVPTGDLPAPAAPEANPAAAAVPNPGETAAQAAARRSRDQNSGSRTNAGTTVASAAGSQHAPPTPSAPLMPEPGPMPMAPTIAPRTQSAAPPPQGPTGAERAQQVLGVVNRAGAVGGCWNQATRRNPAHRNENIQVAIDVAPNGRASSVRVTGAGDPDLALCIQTRVRSTLFPPGEAVSTRASYSLSPGH